MRFLHIADCHVGCWREERLRQLSVNAFLAALDAAIAREVDFVLICGDLFNTAIPALDCLKAVVEKLKALSKAGIACYAIPGSHDFSTGGKSMLDVLDAAGLIKNVARTKESDGKLQLEWTWHRKVALTGMPGKKGGLEAEEFKRLSISEPEAELKIFLFHTSIQGVMPGLPGLPAAALPKGFDYYAGGHLHVRHRLGKIAYPGPTFPTNFNELEQLRHGCALLWENGAIKEIALPGPKIQSFALGCTGLTPAEIEEQLKAIQPEKGAILLIKLSGAISGSPAQIQWQAVLDELHAKGAWLVLRSSALAQKTFEPTQIEKPVWQIEEELLSKAESGIFKKEEEQKLLRTLLHALALEKGEDESLADYETRIKKEGDKVFGLA